ncbi:MAG: alpha/beta hydrolase [Verrucomicrobiota bacterium]
MIPTDPRPRARLFPVLLAVLISAFLASPLQAQPKADAKKKSTSPASNAPSIVWVNTPKERDLPLPTGLTHHTFYSAAAKTNVGYCIYLPPGYETAGDKRYPVIYNLHGNGGNEFHSLEDVKLLHEGIVAGKWPPLIMVLPNGGKSTFYKDSFDGRFPIETMFIKEFIPHIDKTYRTIAARHGRCIEGFSMGGRGSTRLALKYPDLFCSLFCQAGNVPRTADGFDPAKPTEYPNSYLGPDRQNYVDNDVYHLLKKNVDRIKGRLRIQIACGTKDSGHLPTIKDFHNALLEQGIDHTYIELENLDHQRTEMLKRLAPVWFDYHIESMRLATPKN